MGYFSLGCSLYLIGYLVDSLSLYLGSSLSLGSFSLTGYLYLFCTLSLVGSLSLMGSRSLLYSLLYYLLSRSRL